MDYSLLVTMVTALLRCEGRVSYRTLKNGLDLDDQIVDALRFELVDFRRLARDEGGEGLVWIGGEVGPSSSLLPAQSRRQAAERRRLTVMFCDLVGSTVLSAKLDPEDLRELIAQFQAKCREAIQRYGGFIARYMGDGLLVYFGFPQAHEDDVERAVRSGLVIVHSMTELNAEIGTRHEVALAVRVGVATGPVVVGDIVGEGAAEESAAVGETPNLAARLHGIAEPNQVVVSSETHRVLEALFEHDYLGTHELKGIAEPVPAWRVVAAREVEDRYEATHDNDRQPLVGRQQELGLLVRSWEASKERRGQVVLIQGEPGIGKSRLVAALRDHASQDGYLRAVHRCSPYHANSTLYPAIEHLRRVLGWRPEDGPRERLERIESALEERNVPLAEAVPLYADLLSLPLPAGRYARQELSAEQRRERTLDALAGWLLDEAERTPVLNAWEDLQWADPTTLDLVGLYIDQSPTVAMLTVLTYRPEFTPAWPTRPHMMPITLDRLDRSEVEALIGNQANGKAVPSEVLEVIVSKADGVPLYAEELTKTILESSYLREETDRYALTRPLCELSIPATLQDSLMARLDRSPTQREVAQLGAVLGREFSYEMLQPIAPLEEPLLRDGLRQLVENDLLYQRGHPPRSRYIFKHALIQDAAYQSLLKRRRQQYHKQVARLLEERFSDAIAGRPELIAHHYAEGRCTEEALIYWQRAGQIALDRSANVEAVTHFGNALKLLAQLPESPERHQRELDMQMALGPALVATRGFADAGTGRAYARAWALCHLLEDDTHLPLVLRGRQVFHLNRGELDQAQEFARQFLDLAERRQDPALLVGSYLALGQTSFHRGDLTEARKSVEQGITLFDPDQHRLQNWPGGQPGEQCYLYDAFVLWMLGYPEQAAERSEQALAMAEQLMHPANLINTLVFVSAIHVFRRESASAQRRAEAALEMSTEHRNSWFLAPAMVMHGWAKAARGELEDGVVEVSRGITTCRDRGALSWLPFLLCLQAETHARANRPGNGLSSVTEALALADKMELRYLQAELLRTRGELLLAVSGGNKAEAEGCFLRAVDMARRQQAKSLELRAATSLGRLWHDEGNRANARDLLAPVYDWFTEGLDTSDLRDAEALLGSLS